MKPGDGERCPRAGRRSWRDRNTVPSQASAADHSAWAILCAVCAIALLSLTPGVAAKQKPALTKEISGVVLDASDHGVPGASVFLTDLETHHTDAIYSGPDGAYSFSGLNPHDDFQVQAKYKGAVSEMRNASSFDLRPKVVINLVLGTKKPN